MKLFMWHRITNTNGKAYLEINSGKFQNWKNNHSLYFRSFFTYIGNYSGYIPLKTPIIFC